ncbi:unannotated protein [freshwater metagenome]|uniref:Unannotated protein n=1 Tax=freshwater metagenome TaxID=449393 RepID=A0A6J7K9Y9_9ZZZZ
MPVPPKIETPPRTTAAIAVSSKPSPTLPAAVELRSVSRIPARAATTPLRTNSRSWIRSTRRPLNRAASRLAPIAKIARPNGVRCSTIAKIAASTRNRTIVFGTTVPAKLPNAQSV